jgi:hypothetical protein
MMLKIIISTRASKKWAVDENTDVQGRIEN